MVTTVLLLILRASLVWTHPGTCLWLSGMSSLGPRLALSRLFRYCMQNALAHESFILVP